MPESITNDQTERSVLRESEGAPHGLFATHKARLTTDLLDFIKV